MNNKICPKCRSIKPVSEFYKDKNRSDGYRAYCIPCEKVNRDKNKEYMKVYGKEYRLNNIDRVKENNKQWYILNKEKMKKYHRNRQIEMYGITIEQHNEMLKQQNGKCAICGCSPKGKSLNIDHDHTTGKVRALLCNRCNTVLGKVNENKGILSTMIEYIKHYE